MSAIVFKVTEGIADTAVSYLQTRPGFKEASVLLSGDALIVSVNESKLTKLQHAKLAS